MDPEPLKSTRATQIAALAATRDSCCSPLAASLLATHPSIPSCHPPRPLAASLLATHLGALSDLHSSAKIKLQAQTGQPPPPPPPPPPPAEVHCIGMLYVWQPQRRACRENTRPRTDTEHAAYDPGKTIVLHQAAALRIAHNTRDEAQCSCALSCSAAPALRAVLNNHVGRLVPTSAAVRLAAHAPFAYGPRPRAQQQQLRCGTAHLQEKRCVQAQPYTRLTRRSGNNRRLDAAHNMACQRASVLSEDRGVGMGKRPGWWRRHQFLRGPEPCAP